MRVCHYTALTMLGAGVATACTDAHVAPEPLATQYYHLMALNDQGLPAPYLGGTLISAKLVPYGVGRTIDQRLVNDRTGRGSTGGNTRDTTILRGQMMDIRVVRVRMYDGTFVNERDSTIVDVEIRDTMFIISRPFPDPARTAHDTGFVLGRMLVVPTRISRVNYGKDFGSPAVLQYEIRR